MHHLFGMAQTKVFLNPFPALNEAKGVIFLPISTTAKPVLVFRINETCPNLTRSKTTRRILKRNFVANIL